LDRFGGEEVCEELDGRRESVEIHARINSAGSGCIKSGGS
jgi:hypothetical protein